jgi:hypothetical protein
LHTGTGASAQWMRDRIFGMGNRGSKLRSGCTAETVLIRLRHVDR